MLTVVETLFVHADTERTHHQQHQFFQQWIRPVVMRAGVYTESPSTEAGYQYTRQAKPGQQTSLAAGTDRKDNERNPDVSGEHSSVLDDSDSLPQWEHDSGPMAKFSTSTGAGVIGSSTEDHHSPLA